MTARVDGVRLRILMTKCKKRIAKTYGAESWQALLKLMGSELTLQKRVHQDLSAMADPRYRLQLDDIRSLCSFEVRNFGNAHAHEASNEELLESVERDANKNSLSSLSRLLFFETGIQLGI